MRRKKLKEKSIRHNQKQRRRAWEIKRQGRWSHGWYVLLYLACWWWAMKLQQRESFLTFLIFAYNLLHLKVVIKMNVRILRSHMIEAALQSFDVVEDDPNSYFKLYLSLNIKRKIKFVLQNQLYNILIMQRFPIYRWNYVLILKISINFLLCIYTENVLIVMLYIKLISISIYY